MSALPPAVIAAIVESRFRVPLYALSNGTVQTAQIDIDISSLNAGVDVKNIVARGASALAAALNLPVEKIVTCTHNGPNVPLSVHRINFLAYVRDVRIRTEHEALKHYLEPNSTSDGSRTVPEFIDI